MTDNDYLDMLALGQTLVNNSDYENALEVFASILQKQISEFGDLDPNCAEAYYYYGKTLLTYYRQRPDIFDKNPASENLTSTDTTDVKTCLEYEDTPANEDDENDDLQLSWENLESARVILEKEGCARFTLYSDVLLQLGLASYECGRDEEACSNVLQSLDVLEKNDAKQSRRYASSAFDLGNMFESRKMYQEAQKYYEISRNFFSAEVQRMKLNFSQNRDKIDEFNDIIAELDDKVERIKFR